MKKEIASIQKATESFGWDDDNATFDYVLVNKNAHVFSPYRKTLIESSSAKSVYQFNIADSIKETGYKYQYCVQYNPSKVLSQEQLKTLTRHLNSDFQQNNANVAIVLPVHYARKLAKRMYDYFYFATTNRYDNVSAVQRRLGFSNEKSAENDQQMTDMMKEYLLGYGKVEESMAAKPDRKNLWLPELDDKMFYL